MKDDSVVQAGGALPEGGEPSPGAEPPEGGEPQPQPLTEERIKQIVTEATTSATEVARREIQSIKDKARSEVEAAQARALLAEGTLAGIDRAEDLDPQAVKMAKLEASDKFHRQQAFITQRQQQEAIFNQKFNDNMSQFVANMGIEINDKRLDWGNDAKDYWEKQQRILASVNKIQKEGQKALQDNLTQQQTDFEAKIRKDLGLDSEDTSISAGVGVDFQKLSAEDKIKAGLKESKTKRK